MKEEGKGGGENIDSSAQVMQLYTPKRLRVDRKGALPQTKRVQIPYFLYLDKEASPDNLAVSGTIVAFLEEIDF